jgi:hypothetical protein
LTKIPFEELGPKSLTNKKLGSLHFLGKEQIYKQKETNFKENINVF